MKAHEYQGRRLLQDAGAAVPRFEVIDAAERVPEAITYVLSCF